ncbi:MAG: hypothetical protein ACI9N3_002324, partial [Colwellia sp.]
FIISRDYFFTENKQYISAMSNIFIDKTANQ